MTQQPLPLEQRVLRDPAMAAAVAKCVIAKLEPNSVITYQAHPKPCVYCEFPFERKLAAVQEFVQWAGFGSITDYDPSKEPQRFPDLRSEVEMFLQLPREEQARQATVAAGYLPNEFGEPLLDESEREWQEKLIRKAREAQGNAEKRKEAQGRKDLISDEKNSSPRSTRRASPCLTGGAPQDDSRTGGEQRSPDHSRSS